MKKRLSLEAYKALQGLNGHGQVYELKPAEQYLLDWGRKDGSITHWEMNPYYQTWCNRYYPDLRDEKKLKARFAYQANKLVKLGYFNKPNRIGLGPGSRIELYGSATSQTIWELLEPKPKTPTPDGFLTLKNVGGKLVWQ
jgi:hypothetical protein